jgi:membrane-bound metal-dependent hydrolase YbcI (DUF457 family)
MFLGHYGIGLAAKKIAPKSSLGLLLAAAQWLDVLWPIFLILGMEHVRISADPNRFPALDFYDYPISHSLLMAAIWALLWGLVAYALKADWKIALILPGLVLSHWFLDYLVHRPDLPLAPRGFRMMGLGLWNSPFWTIILEFTIFFAGFGIYIGCTKAKDAIGAVGPWVLGVLLGGLYIGSLFSGAPPNVDIVAWVSLSLLLIFPLAHWIDGHRKPL